VIPKESGIVAVASEARGSLKESIAGSPCLDVGHQNQIRPLATDLPSTEYGSARAQHCYATYHEYRAEYDPIRDAFDSAKQQRRHDQCK
jgi:hypothetical protein